MIYIIDEPMKWEELKLRAEDDFSVDMDITDCGICGSDIHTMDSNWGTPNYPVCVVSFLTPFEYRDRDLLT